MTAEAQIAGVVEGGIFRTGVGVLSAVSFMLADDQRALTNDGVVVSARVAWCQVVCRSMETMLEAVALTPGDEVTVRGALEVVRPTPDIAQCDAVLVTLVADDIEAVTGAPPGYRKAGGSRV